MSEVVNEMKVTAGDAASDKADLEKGLATMLNALKFAASLLNNELFNGIIVRIEALSKMPWFLDLLLLLKKIFFESTKRLEEKSEDLHKVVVAMKEKLA